MSSMFQPGGTGSRSTSKATRIQAEPTEVFIEVGDKRRDAHVVRNGIPLGSYELNPAIFDEFFAGRPRVDLKVVSQSIAAGTPVPEGTTVNLVLAQPGRLPVGVIEGVHRDLVDQEIAATFQRVVGQRENDIRRIVARTEERGALTADDEQTVREIFQQADLSVTEEAGRSVDAAYNTMRVLLTFGG